MTTAIALYCKSYRTDLRRVLRLAESIKRFNVDALPFYVSAPSQDVELFRTHLLDADAVVLDDDSIIACNDRLSIEEVHALPGHLSQQLIKSEFWRLGLARSYMCLDSDAVFIRPFYRSDYLWQDDTPYTVIDEGHEFLHAALEKGRQRAIDAFFSDARKVQDCLGRSGRTYSFGPFPVVWHGAVWHSLAQSYLEPQGKTLLDAITEVPVESHWYGEALLRFQAIELMPCQPHFKVYHYAWQLDHDRRKHMGTDALAQLYSGVIYQSAWERDMDWPQEGGSVWSRLGRRLRRSLGRI